MLNTRKLISLSLLIVMVCLVTVGCNVNAPALPESTQSSEKILDDLPTDDPAPEEGLPADADTAVPSTPVAVEDEPISNLTSILAQLEELDIDEFFEAAFKQLILRSPERLTAMGLSAAYGLRNDRLDDISAEYILETQELESALLTMLRSYDRQALTDQQQVSYDVYEWYLDDLVRGHVFTYHNYPLHHFIRSYHFGIEALFTDMHPLHTLEDIEDYIARLSQVDDQVAQLVQGLEVRTELGVIPPGFILDLTKSALYETLQLRSPDPSMVKRENLSVYTRIDQAIDDLAGLSETEKNGLREAALVEIEASFIPAYFQLIDYVSAVQPLSTNDAGLWKLPQGKEYYAYMLRQESTTDLTPDEIHQIGLDEVKRVREDMTALLEELGYSDRGDFSSMLRSAINDAGYYNISTQSGRDQVVEENKRLIAIAEERMHEAFDLQMSTELVITGGPSPASYYEAGSPVDGRPGKYNVALMGSQFPKYKVPTIAYHEAVPGHHFQVSVAQGLDLPMFQNEIGFNAHGEGWALYAERIAWEMGLYADDPYGNLGRLQYELLRAVRLVTDTGIHALGWTRQEAKAYMDEAMGLPGWFSHEVERYVVLPGQATGYMLGMLKILELRQLAMDQLGEDFDIKEFHNVVLGNGSLPLSILEQVVETYFELNK